jgi:hypothetical protein
MASLESMAKKIQVEGQDKKPTVAAVHQTRGKTKLEDRSSADDTSAGVPEEGMKKLPQNLIMECMKGDDTNEIVFEVCVLVSLS